VLRRKKRRGHRHGHIERVHLRDRRATGGIGPYLEDRTTIEFARLIEREFGGFVPPPALA
jgi:hypothetical protein